MSRKEKSGMDKSPLDISVGENWPVEEGSDVESSFLRDSG